MSARALHIGLIALLSLGSVDATFSVCCCRVPAALEDSHGCCGAPEPTEGCCHEEGDCQGPLGKPCREKGPLVSGPDTPDLVPAMDLDCPSSVFDTQLPAVSERTWDIPRMADHGPPLFILNASLLI